MLITSNRSVAEWVTVFADPVVATAILDRLLHHSHALTIRGDSYRLRAKRKSGLIKPPAGDGPPVGSASLRSVTDGANLQPRSRTRGWGQFFMTQRGQFRMAFDTSQARVAPPRGASISPMQIMAASANLPIEHFVDYSLIFPIEP
jgi:hypothetical protein